MDLVDLALAEDLGPQGAAGDITSQTFIPESSISSAKIVARSVCVASGLAVAQEVFRRVDPSLTISVACAEGDSLSPGALLLEVTGPTRSILSGERTALNFLGHLCGIATISRRYADALADAFAYVGIASAVKLLDTRKTTPGWRALEKQAVKAGGHTPGHTAYAVESDGQKLLIWGDLVHAHAVQFARPGVSIEFDIDQKQAIATRRSLMRMAAADKFLVAGMHLPFPGIGHVRADGKGSYSWVPIEFAPLSKVANP